MLKTPATLALTFTLGLSLAGCAATPNAERQAFGGAAIGALAGAALGAISGDVGVGAGAALGAAAGATVGGVKGCREDGGCGAQAPSRRQYYDERAGRYYFYDAASGRYLWEDGSPR